MIKCLALVLSALASVPAFSQAFYRLLTVPDTSKFDLVQIDNSYDLYVKRICKKIVKEIAAPCNCVELPTFTKDDVVEYQYLFLSRKHGKIVVINYIKDRNQKFYTAPADDLAETKSGIDDVELNVWYFNQLRFGNFDVSNNTARFQTTFKDYNVHRWKLDIIKDSVKIYSVAVEKKDGFDEKVSESSMALVPLFVKADKYRIVYQRPPEGETTYPPHILPGNKIFVDLAGGCIYLIFDEEISDGRRTVMFKKNRRYSYFPKPNTD